MRKHCKYIKIFLLSFFVIAGSALFGQPNHEDSVHYFEYLKIITGFGNDSIKGKRIPGFTCKDIKGSLFTDKNLQSKVTFVNFWFETCAPCIAEFGALEKLYRNNKSNAEFQFISITFEKDSVIDRIRKKYGLTYPIYQLSSDSCRKIIRGLGYPTNFIVNENIEIVYYLTGGSTNPGVADKFLNYFVQTELDKQLKLKTVK